MSLEQARDAAISLALSPTEDAFVTTGDEGYCVHAIPEVSDRGLWFLGSAGKRVSQVQGLPGQHPHSMYVSSRIGSRILSSRVNPRLVSSPPESVLDRAEHLVSTYKDLTESVLVGLFATGYVDTFVDNVAYNGEKKRPHDYVSAFLRINVALWTVLRDLRNEALPLDEFDQANWEDVSARDIYEVAVGRIKERSIDFPKALTAMLGEASWLEDPVAFWDDKKEKTVTLDRDALNWLHQSVFSNLAPNSSALKILSTGFGRKIRDCAVSVADVQNDRRETAFREALISLAHGVFWGDGIPRNGLLASILLARAMSVPFDELNDVFPRAFESSDLGLDPNTIVLLKELCGPEKSPGLRMSERISAELRSEVLRENAGELAKFSLYTIIAWRFAKKVETKSIDLWKAVDVPVKYKFALTKGSAFCSFTLGFESLYALDRGELDLRKTLDELVMRYGFYFFAGPLGNISKRVISVKSKRDFWKVLLAYFGVCTVSAGGLSLAGGLIDFMTEGEFPDKEEALRRFAGDLTWFLISRSYKKVVERSLPSKPIENNRDAISGLMDFTYRELVWSKKMKKRCDALLSRSDSKEMKKVLSSLSGLLGVYIRRTHAELKRLSLRKKKLTE